MSIALNGVDVTAGIAWVRVHPSSRLDDLWTIASLWSQLQADETVHAVAVIASEANFSSEAELDDLGLRAVGPKQEGLIKPLGLGLRGRVFDYGLQLVAEADVVLATDGALFADTSAQRGGTAFHAAAFNGLIPLGEINRLALMGVVGAMPAKRAAEVGIVDRCVSLADLKLELLAGLRRLIRP